MSARLGLLRQLEREGRVRRDEPVAWVGTDDRITYGQLLDRSAALAHALRATGVSREAGSVVQVVSAERDWCEFLVAGFGVYLAGGVLVASSERLGEEGLRAARRATGADGVLVSTARAPSPAVAALGAVATTRQLVRRGALRGAADPLAGLELDPTGPACVVFTSGSTGAPVPILWSWANVEHDHAKPARDPARDRRRFLTVPSVGSAVAQIMLHDSACGPEFVIAGGPDPEHLTGLVERFEPDTLGLVPAVAGLLVRHLERVPARTGSVRLVVCGSAPLPEQTIRGLGRVFPNARVFNAYGLTEGGVLTSSPQDDPPGSVGRAGDDVEVQIRDGYGRPLPSGVPGELWLRELGKPPRTVWAVHGALSTRLQPDGWVRTGDRAWADADGHVFLDGRLDEIVDVAGASVSLVAVEAQLARHPSVAAAGVVAVPHPIEGHRLVGVCSVTDGVTDGVTESSLLREVNARLGGSAVLHALHCVAQLPWTVNRKLDRAALRALVDGRAAATEGGDVAGEASEDVRAVALRVWRTALARPELEPDDDLLALGGHSLVTVDVAMKLRVALDREVPVELVARTGTVAELVLHLERALERGSLPARVRIPRRGSGSP